MTVSARLAQLGVTLPAVASPAANYVSFVRAGNQLHMAGTLPRDDAGNLIVGQLGDLSVEEGQKAARQCMLSFIAAVNAATNGNLDKVKKIVKLNVFVNSKSDFTQQPFVANGASDFVVQVFGEEVGRHARAAVGVAQLPFGVAVEIDGIVLLDDSACQSSL